MGWTGSSQERTRRLGQACVGQAGGRQHAGGLARPAQSRSIQVVAGEPGREGGTEGFSGAEGIGVGPDSRHPCPSFPGKLHSGTVRTRGAWSCCCLGDLVCDWLSWSLLVALSC